MNKVALTLFSRYGVRFLIFVLTLHKSVNRVALTLFSRYGVRILIFVLTLHTSENRVALTLISRYSERILIFVLTLHTNVNGVAWHLWLDVRLKLSWYCKTPGLQIPNLNRLPSVNIQSIVLLYLAQPVVSLPLYDCRNSKHYTGLLGGC